MTPSHVRECLASLRDELYELALDLVRTPSVTGDEDAAQETLAARFRDWGLDVDLWTVETSLTAHRAYCDDGLPVERQNLVARWGEPRETAALILNGTSTSFRLASARGGTPIPSTPASIETHFTAAALAT